MATLEELQQQLAALQAKVNAITSPPEDYYTSRYSGEELDNIVDKANDWAETDKIVRQLPGQNLLDNSVFVDGCLVDQRGGYVVPPNTPYYIPGETTPSGVTSGYTKVEGFLAANNGPFFTIDNTIYATIPGTAVRGYTGGGYGIDRWKIEKGTAQILSDCVRVIPSGISAESTFFQIIDKSLSGRTVTLSVLIKGIDGLTLPAQLGVMVDGIYKNTQITGAGLYSLTFTVNDLIRWVSVTSQSTTGYIDVYAAKLELGTQQTLAHQDENGVWHLNALPNYADTLARCQRYYFKVKNGTYNISDSFFTVQFPTTMRALPSFNDLSTSAIAVEPYSGNAGFYAKGAFTSTSRSIYSAVIKTSVGGESPLTGKIFGDVSFEFIADL